MQGAERISEVQARNPLDRRPRDGWHQVMREMLLYGYYCGEKISNEPHVKLLGYAVVSAFVLP